MNKARPVRLCWTSMAARVTRIVRPMPAILTILLAGCTAGNLLQPAAPNDRVDRGAQNTDVPTVPISAGPKNAEPCAGCPPGTLTPMAEGSSKLSPAHPAPRTLPQAFRAYLRCLCLGPPVSDKQSISQPAEQEQAKNPAAEGDSSAKDRNGKPEQSQNPPTDVGTPATGNGKDSENDKEKEKEEWYSAHAQATVVTEKHSRFRSPYAALNSLPSAEHYVTSETTTAFLAARLWEGGELVFNPEVAGGRGFGMVTGIANYPNQEITRVGIVDPTPYIARLYLRQTFGFGGEQEKVQDDVNQVAGWRDVSRLTVSVGKLASTDVADDNRYSHDSRTSFLPWAMVYNGAWDYPANVRGYTYGVAFDLNEKEWALHYGVFAVAHFANSPQLDPHILRANGHILELERRYTLNDHAGSLRLWGFLNVAHMGKYSEALAEMPVNPDVTLTRAYRIKYGFGGNVEQELTKDLGAFARFGWNDGHTETWMFTEIDATLVVGLLLKGRCWCRPQDQVGLAVAVNGLSKEHRDYLAAGGLGFVIGDGRLNYGLEKTLEWFYNLEVHKGISFALDLQGIDDPAYNRDRGPVLVVSGRLHIEF